MAVLALSAGGSVLGGTLIGGSFAGVSAAQWGWMIGSVVGNRLFGPKGTDTEGPRLNDTVYTGQVEGTDMPILWGGDRITGKPIWIKTPPTTIKTTTETGGGKGGPPSSKHTTFSYLQDFAISFGEFICEEPPRKVWLNHELVYDASGNNTEVQDVSFQFSWYSGIDDSIDSIIEQDVGIGNCPSYKGRCIMVITGLNLTARYGNRLPVVEAELQTTGVLGTNISDVNLGSDPDAQGYSQIGQYIRHPIDYSILAIPGGNYFDKGEVFYFDIASRNGYIISRSVSSNGFTTLLWYTNPLLYSQEAADHYITAEWKDAAQDNYVSTYEYPSGKLKYFSIWTLGNGGIILCAESQYVLLYTGREFGSAVGFGTKTSNGVLDPGSSYSTDTISSDTGLSHNDFWNATCIDYFNNKFGFFGVSDTNSELAYWIIDAGGIGNPTVTRTSEPFSDLADSTSFSGPADFERCIYIKEHNEIWAIWSNSGSTYDFGLICLNASTGARTYFSDFVIDGYVPNTYGWPSGSGFPILNYDPIARRLWWIASFSGTNAVAYLQVDTKLQKWYITDGQDGAWAIGYPNRNSYWSAYINGSAEFIMREVRLGQISQGNIAISEIIADICDRLGYEATRYDVSELTSDFIGSFIHSTRHSGRSDIEILLGVAVADAVQSDYKLKFIKRGGAISYTIPEDDLATQEITSGSSEIEPIDLVDVSIPMDIEVPKVYEITYRSSDNSYLSGIVQSYIATGLTESPETAQLPMALTDQQAGNIAEIYHNQMIEPKTFKFSLPVKYYDLESTDVIEIPKGTRNYRVRINSITRGNNWILECEGIKDRIENYSTTSLVPGVENFIGTIGTEIRPKRIIIDGPLIRDVDLDHPGPYLTSYVSASTYTGAVWYYSIDDTNWFEIFSQNDQPIIGICDNAYNSEIWEDWDDTTTIRLTILNDGSLSSSTKSAIEADPTINAFAYGTKGRWEYLNAATCTLISSSPKVYDLSNLLRGRRGTDNHINIHEEKDYIIRLDSTGIQRQTLQNSQVGNTIYYRLPNLSESVSDVFSESNEVLGQQLKPYSPIQISPVDNAGDIDITWTRRTRKGGSLGGDNTLTDGVGGPLNEDYEQYEIDYKNTTTEVILGSVSNLTTTSHTYTSAQQTVDGTDLLGRFYVDVYQMSAVVGRGFRGRGLFDRGWTDLINEYIDLGATAIFPLNDAGTANAKEWVTQNATAGSYTSSSTSTALLTDNSMQSLAGDSSGYMKCGTVLRDGIANKNKASIVLLASGDLTATGRLIDITQGASTSSITITHGSQTWTLGVAPKSGATGLSTSLSAQAIRKTGRVYMIAFTIDLDGVYNISKYMNGSFDSDSVFSTGHSSYASTFQTETRNTSYNDTINGTSDSTPTSLVNTGSIGFVAIFDSVLTPTQISNLWQNVYSELYESYDTNDCNTLCNLEDYFLSTTGTDFTTYKGIPWKYGATDFGDGGVCLGCNFSTDMTSTAWIYNTIPTVWKVQDFSIEITILLKTAASGTQWLLSLGPRDWNGTTKRGFHILHDATTNGLTVRLGDGSFNDYSDGTPTFTSLTTYHVVITVSSTNGTKGYVNGTEVLNSSGTTHTINWTDNTSGFPDIGSGYLCCYNDGGNQNNPNNKTAGLIGALNRFSFWTKELSSAEVTNLYKRNLGIL